MLDALKDFDSIHQHAAAATPRAQLPVDVLNPGTSRPENSAQPAAVNLSTPSTFMPAATKTSDGDPQRLDLRPLQGGVTSTKVPRLMPNASNGQFQSRNFTPLDQCTSATDKKLRPVDVSVSSQNLRRHSNEFAEALPLPSLVDAGKQNVGGVASDHMIK